MAPVARRLGARRGVLEPIQTAATLEGQIEELREIVRGHGRPPVVLVGFSWGAWLGCILAARHPVLVRKLILVGSGPFEDRYVPALRQARESRLTAEERVEYRAIQQSLAGAALSPDRASQLARLGELASRADSFDPLPESEDPRDAPELSDEIYRGVWPAAAEMRASGALLREVARVRCPVFAIHGANDPHPAEGVEVPLRSRLADFRLIVLERCGHAPWRERHAAEDFFAHLEEELETGIS